MNHPRFRHLVLAALMLAAVAPPAHGSPSNKWRIQCSEGAKSDGEIVFEFAPKGGDAFDVVVKIPDGTSENHLARIIRDTFRQVLDKSKFSAEVDDGEDVLVKKKSGAPDFDLKVKSSTVRAARIVLDRE